MNIFRALRTPILVAVSGLVFASCASDSTNPGQATIIRKNVSSLSTQERKDFIGAILKLKQTPSPFDVRYNYYDQFVAWHLDAFYCNAHPDHSAYPAHMNPAFLPWHRTFLRLFEKALRDVSGKDVAVPYWDWTEAGSVDKVFTDDFMGGDGDASDGYAVKTGPFRKGNFPIAITDTDDIDSIHVDVDTEPNPVPYLTRGMRTYLDKTVYLPTTAEVAQTLDISTYDSAPWDSSVDSVKSFRNSLEGWRGVRGDTCENGIMDVIPIPGLRRSTQHNIVHIWVGGIFKIGDKTVPGNMTQATSPNDPVFWIHHSNIDRIWTAWLKRHGRTYVPASGGRTGTNLNDVMPPFQVSAPGYNTPSQVLDEEAVGYRYEQLP